jgi:hypothetical protein
MLTAASTAAAHGLSASGCSIYRKDKSSECIVAAEYGEIGDKNEIESVIAKLGDGDGIIESEIGSWRVLTA